MMICTSSTYHPASILDGLDNSVQAAGKPIQAKFRGIDTPSGRDALSR
jgi:hypothetical protein